MQVCPRDGSARQSSRGVEHTIDHLEAAALGRRIGDDHDEVLARPDHLGVRVSSADPGDDPAEQPVSTVATRHAAPTGSLDAQHAIEPADVEESSAGLPQPSGVEIGTVPGERSPAANVDRAPESRNRSAPIAPRPPPRRSRYPRRWRGNHRVGQHRRAV